MIIWTIEELLKRPSLVMRVIKENLISGHDIVKSKIYYGVQKNQYILIFVPRSVKRRDGVVFFIHGGGWTLFSPEDMRFIGNFFARYGFPTVMPGYRPVPGSKFPSQMIDIFSAFKKYVEVSGEYGLNYKKTIAAGQSAGGELAGLLVYNRLLQEKFGIDPEYFRALISISGPLDLTLKSKSRGIERMFRNYAPTHEDRDLASPIRYVTGNERIPVLCIHGQRDPIIDLSHSRSFVAKINEKNEDLAELRVIRDSNHSDLAGLFLKNFKETKSLIRWIADKIV